MKRMFLLMMLTSIFRPSLLYGQDRMDSKRAQAALERAVTFYRENVSVSGGSVFRVSSDLTKREGENKVGPREVWIEQPGTAAVGMAYLKGWQLTGDPLFLDAMLETAGALVQGQLESGGWGENIEFDPLLRKNYFYRTDHRTNIAKRRNRTTFDDNKSQLSLEFLMSVDRELEFKNASIHEAALYALDTFAKAQYPNGAWPQQYTEAHDASNFPVGKAKFPKTWSRTYKRSSYSRFYTLNDNTISDVIEMMMAAHTIYGDDRWAAAARHGGDFLIAAQLPDPQPGWAQQYNIEMEPVWARKFEPPAITGGESQGVINTLMTLYDWTGEQKYLDPVPRAIAYYRSVLLKDGQLARFYEIGTDKPLYFTREYKLVYTDNDLPTHYAFKVGSNLDRLDSRYKQLVKDGPSRSFSVAKARKPRLSKDLTKRAEKIVKALDKRGAWVEKGTLRNFRGDDQVDKVIDSRTYARNVLTLAMYIAASRGE